MSRRWPCSSPPAGLVGPLLVLTGAWAFAGANAVAKSIYQRGMSELSLFLIRSLVVYLMNAAVVLLGKQPEQLRTVMLLRVATRRSIALY